MSEPSMSRVAAGVAFAPHGEEAPLLGLSSDQNLDQVELLLLQLGVGSRLDRLGNAVQEHLATGGSRTRARLALAAGEAVGLERETLVPWAVACEMLHNATLVHDDLQDGDEVRRGRPALWAAHGPAQAVNAGDLMLMLPYTAVGRLDAPGAVRWQLCEAVARRAEETVRGQASELDLLPSRSFRWEQWERAARGKSGALLALPVEGAARLAGLEARTALALAEPFATLGVLYQATDDLVDLWGDKGREQAGNDLREGKVSALVAAHLALNPADEAALHAALSLPRHETTDAVVSAWTERFATGGARAAVQTFVSAQARALLDVPMLRAVPPLRDVAEELVQLLRSKMIWR
jgi:geranylgeranyl diphosphate synthase, type I